MTACWPGSAETAIWQEASPLAFVVPEHVPPPIVKVSVSPASAVLPETRCPESVAVSPHAACVAPVYVTVAPFAGCVTVSVAVPFDGRSKTSPT